MPQNLISLTLTEADHAAIADALSTLESKLTGLISLSAEHRRSLNKMGEKSETFCRRTLVTMNENPKLIPAEVDVAEAQRDLAQLDALRPHIARLRTLTGRAEDSAMALGSDAMVAALEGYALCARQRFWPGRPAQRHGRPFHAQDARPSKSGAKRLNPGPQGSKAPFAGLFSWGSGCAGFARKPFLLAAKARAPGAWGSKACAARLKNPPLGIQSLARQAQSRALGPHVCKVQG